MDMQKYLSKLINLFKKDTFKFKSLINSVFDNFYNLSAEWLAIYIVMLSNSNISFCLENYLGNSYNN